MREPFSALGHGLLIPLFFVSIGLTSDFRALGGHWVLLGVIFFIAVISKMVGCGLAAMARGMGPVRSLRIGCGMVSRGEVGLIVVAIAVKANVFKQPEVAMMVTVVVLTTLLTPLALRGAFQLNSHEDDMDISGGMDEFPDQLGESSLEGSHRESGQSMSSVRHAPALYDPAIFSKSPPLSNPFPLEDLLLWLPLVCGIRAIWSSGSGWLSQLVIACFPEA